ncbi:replication protein A 70 kDa DNA-binding subunit B-like isoform X6 [Phragmites australis]|uniref:replication protein A 70 kDa DNA-binding subunit B-like isoform X6 n=1 Tax=Phragmites australis TaxID=29695 RepID=UPI002D77D049|nr:replication protein A 70 kDa DNA-binding subunit B-like isoform X6 [Phragmites australis]XP_062183404.1 replication protein A 70 kDa DNA-binding subunit B-like isoform X6 [Phragmites australis]XP_062183405.1 replication protein A 70 kDa DNA-binding subunit B-like isoform X6 [Phragmites australis]
MYRPVDHEYMMRFTKYTRVVEVNPVPDTFPMYACKIASFAELRERVGVQEFSSDAIGIFEGCTRIMQQNTKNGVKPLRNIYISDGRETIRVALWNQHAYDFNDEQYMEIAKTKTLVFLFVAVTCAWHEGKLSLQGSTICKWYLNPDLPEAAALHDSYPHGLRQPIWHGPAPSQIGPIETTVTDLAMLTNPHTIYCNRYIATIKMKNLLRNQSWWYLACRRCNKTIQAHGNRYKCTGIKCPSTDGEPRYRLAVIATDPATPINDPNPPSIELVFFGPLAEEIIGIPVDALIASSGGVEGFVPPHITRLYGREFRLRISVSPGALQRPNLSYQVDGIVNVGNLPITQPLPILPSTLQEQPTAPSILTNAQGQAGGSSSQKATEITPPKETSSSLTPPPMQTPPNLETDHPAIATHKRPRSPQANKQGKTADSSRYKSSSYNYDHILAQVLIH